MTKSEWLNLYNQNREVLTKLIRRFHPAIKDRKPENAPISVNAAENISEIFRKSYENASIDLDSQDPYHLFALVNGAWMGIPESRSLIESLEGFDTLCTLCERWNEQSFIEYLEQTLIPDLMKSGSEQTALDFATCLAGLKLLKEAKDYMTNSLDPIETNEQGFNLNKWEERVVTILKDQ